MKHVARGVAAALLLLASIGASAPGLGAAGAAGAAATQADGWHLDIDRAIDAIGLKAGMVIGEAGAGEGYFTFPMARRVGATGVVLANDISTRALSSIDRRRASEQVTNVQTVVGAVDDPRFPRADLQMLVIVHAFHDFSNPVGWLVNAKKYLAPGATLAIIDKDPAQGAEAHFWTKERIVGHAREAGFVLVKAVDDISAHLILVFTAAAHGSAQTPGPGGATTMTEAQRAKLDTFLRRAIDDKRPELMSVIIRVAEGDGAAPRLAEVLKTRGITVRSTLSEGRLVVVTVTADHLPELATHADVAHISFDAFVKPLAK
jgi:hypothetical protein